METTLDIQNITKLSLTKSGKNIKLVNNKLDISLKTSELFLPFNLNKNRRHWMNYDEYSMDCYINNDPTFSENLIKLDETIFNLSKENINLLGGTTTDDLGYSKMYRENKEYPKLLKLYFPRDNNGNFITHFFDENSKPIIVNERNIETILSKKSIFKTLITCSKVWFYQNKIGTTWNIVQLKLLTKESTPIKETTVNINDSVYDQPSFIE